jgi:hypothetical protein
LSKLSASEFQTWESLYWPDRIPRMSKLPESMPSGGIPSHTGDWRWESNGHSVFWKDLEEAVARMAESPALKERPEPVAVASSDPTLVLAGAAFSFKTGVSVEIAGDESMIGSSCALELSQPQGASQPLAGVEVKQCGDSAPTWEPSEPCISLLFPEDVRVIFPHLDLWKAIESFVAFAQLRNEQGVAVLGSLNHEFGFFAALSSTFAGVPVTILNDVKDLRQKMQKDVSVLFVSRSVDQSQGDVMDSYRAALTPLRKSFSFLGIEGPMQAGLNLKALEKSTGVPVLQMYGISGRGILFSNPREFNLHESAGIPITNVEAIIADNYEGNWTRDRILMGPGVEGELVIRGEFIDGSKDVGDPRQNPVKASIRGQSTDWVTTGVMGKMDENGYFYLKDASSR